MCDVAIANGEVFHNALDFDFPGFPDFEFRRKFSSLTDTKTPMGWGWKHNWQTTLECESDAVKIKDPFAGDTIHKQADCDGKKGPLLHRRDGKFELTYPDRHQLIFERSTHDVADWLLTRKTDAYGNWTNLTYQRGNLMTVEDSEGRRIQFAYGNPWLAQVTLRHRGIEQRMQYEHDAQGRLLRATDPLGQSECFAYDENFLVSHLSEMGRTRYFCYDDQRRCILNWYDDERKVRRLQFSPDGKTVIMLDGLGYREVYRLDDNGIILSMTDPLVRRTEWIYASDGALMCVLLPDGNPKEIATWDDDQRTTLRVVDIRGYETTYRYDEDRGLTTISNSAGQSLQIRTNRQGDVVELLAPNEARWQFDYDDRGSLARFENPEREWIKREEKNGTVRAWDQFGELGEFQFDPLGNLIRDTDALGRRTTYEYAGQQLLTRMVRPDQSEVRWSYDAWARITAVIDGLGRETRYLYSPFGSLVGTIHPDGSQERMTVDKEENLREIINTKGEKTIFNLDAAGRARQVRFFDGRTARYGYDLRNQVVEYEDALGRITHIDYDGADNPEQITMSDQSVRLYSYNGVEELQSIELLAPENSEIVPQRSSFKFNGSNYVTKEAHDEYEVEYDYDRANNLTGVRDSLGRNIRYGIGRWGVITSIEDSATRATLSYNAAEELVGIELASGLAQKFEYDACSRLIRREVVSPQGGIIAWRSFRYDAADQLVGIEDWRLGSFSYEYDVRGRVRLVSQTGFGVVESYNYDSEGNMTSSPEFASLSYEAGNRLIAADNSSWEYDAEGKLVKLVDDAGSWEYVYDAMDQLIAIIRDGQPIARYAYDLVGKRTAKIRPEEEERYFHHANTLATLISSTGQRWDFLFIPFTFIPLAQRSDGRTYMYSWDQAGVPTELWDEHGNLIASVAARCYGSGRTVTYTSSDQPPVPFHFMGQYVDEESDLHYNRFRYYSPRNGRFITQDPFGLAAGSNLYIYPTNPLTWVDPLGLKGGLVLEIKCQPSKPPPFTPCQQKALQTKVEMMNDNLQKQPRKKRCTDCRANEQKDYFIEKCKGKVPKGWQVDHIQELQVGGADKCCANLMAIPARPNASCGSQIHHQTKDYGGSIVGAVIKKPGCKDAKKCKSDGTRRGKDSTSCDEPDPITC